MKARGYSLPFVILILVILSVALASLMFVLTAGARSTESMLGRRKLFYACDGVSRVAAVSAQTYFGQTATPTSADLREFVCDEGGGCIAGSPLLPTLTSQSPGFQVSNFEIRSLGGRVEGQLDSGPFTGMSALMDSVSMNLTGSKPTVGWACDIEQELTLAKISMFQFFIFSDLPYTDWNPGPNMHGIGRVHANGDICFFSDNGPLYVERVTAAGNIYPVGDSGCLNGTETNASPSAARIAVVDDPNFGAAASSPSFVSQTGTLGSAHFRAFSSRNGASWVSTANGAFAKHLQDSAHSVPFLRLPIVGAVSAQLGMDASGGNVNNNAGSRLLVDPLKVVGEDAAVAGQKFAFKADIRIINGVWFLRDINNPAAPGTPIWSDHPLTYTTVAESNTQPGGIAVGQNDIFGTSASLTRPQRYSYYTFSSTGALARTSQTPSAVVSYGTLRRKSNATWEPGYRCSAAAPTIQNTTSTASLCGGATVPSGEPFLVGTRSGFRNGTAQHAGMGEKANVLPINIDVAALQNALAVCGDGELGQHFPGTCNDDDIQRRFNGIVYITSTWINSNNSPPPEAPGQGSIAAQAGLRGEQTAIPYPLCTGTASAPGAGTVIGGTSTQHVLCSRYTNTGGSGDLKNARPTAVRVYNARNINTEFAAGAPALSTAAVSARVLENGITANGLTIATNLPMYVMGDVNRSSDPESTDPLDPWYPVLMAGDYVHILSNNWNDTDAEWGNTLPNVSSSNRDSSESFYNMEILSGWVPTTNSAYSGGLHNFPRFLEDWTSTPLHIRGSLVVGWAAVYTRWKWHCCDDVYKAPQRDWGFDPHLKNILNQPPGAPLFDVQATRRWKR